MGNAGAANDQVAPVRGPLMLIGGAEDKLGQRAILTKFVRLAGGPAARIVVISTASSLGDAATGLYVDLFHSMGVQDVRGARPLSRVEADSAEMVGLLADATGVFMTGGNQMKLSGVVAGTAMGRSIIAAHHRGAVIAGTSAGASAQSVHMVAFGADGATPKLRMVQMAAGLGLIGGVIVDQHFEQRNRYGRLLALVAHSPALLGIGVDEDTAAVITDGRLLEVMGKGSVTVIDGSHARSNVDSAMRTDPLMVSGAVLHVLPARARFDLEVRALLPSVRGATDDLRLPLMTPEPPAASTPAATKKLARRVAREGIGNVG